ncbi:MAG: hypothetical protein ACLUE8_10645 [Lachnospiraceae bacterium]
MALAVWKKRFSLAGYELGASLPLMLAAVLGLWAAADFSSHVGLAPPYLHPRWDFSHLRASR